MREDCFGLEDMPHASAPCFRPMHESGSMPVTAHGACCSQGAMRGRVSHVLAPVSHLFPPVSHLRPAACGMVESGRFVLISTPTALTPRALSAPCRMLRALNVCPHDYLRGLGALPSRTHHSLVRSFVSPHHALSLYTHHSSSLVLDE